ncbi:hypothetical protein ACRRS0_08605 [Agarivorans sp. QJM3NY_29]|uniref:hypothetical protein n=1 Tax=unclassified Agarivorans TaxID=2636026 RepID=UPI003D7F0BF8
MMDEHATLAALQSFVCLAKQADLNACSEQLALPTERILEQLEQLQQRLACSLFVQTGQFYQLSHAGLALVEQAELIVGRYAELQRHCQHLQQAKSLQLSISYQAWFPSPWLTLLAQQLHRYDPLLELRFSGSQQHSVHFSFSANKQHAAAEVFPWKQAQLVKVAHPKLVNHRQQFDAHLKLFDMREPQQSNLFMGETLLLDALQAGLGWAILPQISVESRLAEGTLKAWPNLLGEQATYIHLSAHCPSDLRHFLMQQKDVA